MSIRKTHDRPYSGESPNAWDPCDEKYSLSEKRLRNAEDEISETVEKCLVVTARRLLAGAQLFDQGDPELGQLAKSLRPFRVEDAREALAAFLRANPYQSGQEPEAHFTYACMSMRDALAYLAEGKYDPSYRSSVVCRHALARLGVGRSS